MNVLEAEADELVRKKEWGRALSLIDKLLEIAQLREVSSEKIAALFLSRSECYSGLGRYDKVVWDCRRVLSLLQGVQSVTNDGARARRRLVHALFSLQRFREAEAAAAEWISSSRGLVHNNQEALKMHEHVRILLQLINTQNRPLDEPAADYKGEPWFNEMRRNRNHPVKLLEEAAHESFINSQPPPPHPHLPARPEASEKKLTCSYCGMGFLYKNELRAHCQSEEHQRIIMSDEGRDWKWRPPPRGLTSEEYPLCENWSELGNCKYGAQCVEAHGPAELNEWIERHEYRKMKMQRACEKELYGKSYTEQLMERLSQSPQVTDVMKTKVDGVLDECDSPLSTCVTSKNTSNTWVFSLRTRKELLAVALLQDSYRNHFFLRGIKCQKGGQIIHCVDLGKEQEWVGSMEKAEIGAEELVEYYIMVEFVTDIFGTFRQTIIFDFGSDPVLVKHLSVDVTPCNEYEKIQEVKKEIILTTTERWNESMVSVVPFTSMLFSVDIDYEREKELLATYPTPGVSNLVTQATLNEKRLTRNNYRPRMHELLHIEEMSRNELVSSFNITASVFITNKYLLTPSGTGGSTAKFAYHGEMFGYLKLTKDLSEDTSAGRLILNSCSTVLLALRTEENMVNGDSREEKLTVYEAMIEDKGKNTVYLRISAACAKAYDLKNEVGVRMDVQFQLNRLTYCEWHQAIDKIADFRFIFPDTEVEPTIPWSPQRQWNEAIDPKLNLKQKESVIAITTPVEVQLPPILIIGPFGTGKTYTLAQAIKQVLKQSGTRVLVCTHSNSAADLYIKDYLHPYVEAGHKDAVPLRIYYHKRWVASVSPTVQKYSIIETNDQGVRSFKIPKLEDILKYRVIVVTLNISSYLSNMGLPKGYFSHILLDEAAQAMECEAIMPLALANDNTRIVLAGDHMQLSPEIFSKFAKQRKLHASLLERLYDHYPPNFPCKILLCENYRAHEAIIQFTSELFYEQKLISSGNQPRHHEFYPLTFFTARGDDFQDVNSTAFFNNSEVYEVVERVSELRKKWPESWGKLTDQSIGIMTPYSDQVFRIRSELRKRRLGGISVERVLNVQGKQFRAVFLSTVRTRRTCLSSKDGGSEKEADYGFLSNGKLLNTAITRAQSLVAVVGDPIALCSIGRCRKVWETFIHICEQNNSLFGITWTSLKSQLDGVELKKSYTLNPLAPEFIPRQQQSAMQQIPVMRYDVPPPASRFHPQQYVGATRPQFYLQPQSFYPQNPPQIYHPMMLVPPQAGMPMNFWIPMSPQMNSFGQQGLPPNITLPQNIQGNNFVKGSMNSPRQAEPPPRHSPPRLPPPSTRPPNNIPQQVMPNFLAGNQQQNQSQGAGLTNGGSPRQTNGHQPPQPQQQQARNPQSNPGTPRIPSGPNTPRVPPLGYPQELGPPRRTEIPPNPPPDLQFFPNVHYPERQILPPLPQDVTLQQLLMMKEKQLSWYNQLLESAGPEAAANFREFINQQKKHTQQINGLINPFEKINLSPQGPLLSGGGGPLLSEQIKSVEMVPVLELNTSRAAQLSQLQHRPTMNGLGSSGCQQQRPIIAPMEKPKLIGTSGVSHGRTSTVPLYQRGVRPPSEVVAESPRPLTYAGVLRSRKEPPPRAPLPNRGPLSLLSDLNHTPNGLYHYFP